jgi:hypothetical protein
MATAIDSRSEHEGQRRSVGQAVLHRQADGGRHRRPHGRGHRPSVRRAVERAEVRQAAEVVTDGIAKVVSDGSGTAIAAGDQLGTDTSGRAVKCTTNDRPLLGEAMDASTAPAPSSA